MQSSSQQLARPYAPQPDTSPNDAHVTFALPPPSPSPSPIMPQTHRPHPVAHSDNSQQGGREAAGGGQQQTTPQLFTPAGVCVFV